MYLHIPFCERKCAYCDFASWTGREGDEDKWLRRILSELALRGSQATAPLQSIFFGGGTPSALSPSALEAVCAAVRTHFTLAPDCEWTSEANPVSLDSTKLEILRSHGVNRISLGVQSFEPDLLQRMGRAHDVRGAEVALDLVASSGLRWSADLIFALPDQSTQRFLASLERLLQWSPQHVSFYGLTIEEGTDFWKAQRAGTLEEASEDVYEESYVAGVQRLQAAGIERYEVSNFAVPGQECRHNLSYWDSESSWLACGNSAHGYRPYLRWRNPRGLQSWMSWVDQGCPESGTAPEELDADARWLEAWLLGLRTHRGVHLAEVAQRHQRPLPEAALQRALERKLIQRHDDVVQLTEAGWLLLDSLVVEFAS